MGFFPAIFDRPDKIRFIEQNDDEVIELLLRKHPITNLPWIIISTIAVFLPFLIALTDRSLALNLIEQLPGAISAELLIIYDLLILAYAIESFLYWYFNIYIITNQHLVDISFNSILNREVTESQYDEVQTVSSNIKGAIHEFFSFGTITIETAAKDESLVFVDIPDPDFVADRIRDIQQKAG